MDIISVIASVVPIILLDIISVIASVVTIILFIYFIYDRRDKRDKSKIFKTYYGNCKVILGNNSLLGCNHLIVINGRPIISVIYKRHPILCFKNRLLLSGIIFNSKNQVITEIAANNFNVNEKVIFKKEFSRNKVSLFDFSGNCLFHCRADRDGSLTIYGGFYAENVQITMSTQGMKFYDPKKSARILIGFSGSDEALLKETENDRDGGVFPI